ncbi:MAG: 6-bladed beta-propeller, partial [Gemmatimonadota bacterium]
LGNGPFVVRAAGGHIFAGGLSPDRRVLVYDSTGRFAGTIGRSGEGPGEWRIIQRLVSGPADSLYIFDFNRRMVVFSPSGRVVRTVTQPLRVVDALPLSNGSVVLSGALTTPAGIGYPFHLVSADGRHVRSFGMVDAVRGCNDLSSVGRHLSLASNGSVWAVPSDSYEIQRWDTAGVLRGSFVRRPAWFEYYKQTYRRRGSEGEVRPYLRKDTPESWIRGVREDRSGRLWVLIAVAATDWESHGIMGGEGQAVTHDVRDKLYDTIVEVIDPRTARVVTRARLSFNVAGFASDDVIIHHREAPNGLRSAELWRLEFISQ